MEKKVLLIEVGTDGTMRFVGELQDSGRLNIAAVNSPATDIENAVAPPGTETTTAPGDETPHTATAAEAPAVATGPIRLDPKDPNFEEQKQELKELGFRYVGKYQQWYPPRESKPEVSEPSQFENWWGNAPAVGLSKDDPDFGEKMAALKKAGYRWNKTLSLWQSPQQ